jgi:hypothetical protein
MYCRVKNILKTKNNHILKNPLRLLGSKGLASLYNHNFFLKYNKIKIAKQEERTTALISCLIH